MSKPKIKRDEQFKRDAVELSLKSDKNCKDIAEDLGVSYNALIRWRKEYRDKGNLAFPGNGKQNLSPEEQEIIKLKKELKIAKEERDILKKAVSIFSKKPQ